MKALIGPPLKRSAKIANFLGAYASLPLLALEVNLERYEVHTQNPNTVDSTASNATADLNFREIGLP